MAPAFNTDACIQVGSRFPIVSERRAIPKLIREPSTSVLLTIRPERDPFARTTTSLGLDLATFQSIQSGTRALVRGRLIAS